MGFSIGAATIAAGCEMPLESYCTWRNRRNATGTATWYATTYNENGDYCPVLFKTKDGRPIKIEVILNQLLRWRHICWCKHLYLTCMIILLTGPMQKKRNGKLVIGIKLMMRF